MSGHGRRAAALAALVVTAGCTLGDWRGEPRLLPEGPLFASSGLVIEIRTEGQGPKAQVFIDGREWGRFAVNERVELDLRSLAEGRHTLFARVFDGPNAKDTPERSFEVERVAPTIVAVEPPPGAVYTPDGLRVTLTFSEPVDPTRLGPDVEWVTEPLNLSVTSTAIVSPDGLSAEVTYPGDLGAGAATMLISGTDLAGNRLFVPELLRWTAPPSPFSVPSGLVAHQFASVPVVTDPAWTGATGPLVVFLCPSSVGLPIPRYCVAQPLSSAAEVATFDTASLPEATTWRLFVSAPGLLPSAPREITVHHPRLSVTITPSRAAVNGPVDLRITGQGDLPEELEIRVSGGPPFTVPVGAGVGTFERTVTWDAAVPDGSYGFSAHVPTWQVTTFQPIQLRVDRTPPTFHVIGDDPVDPWSDFLILSPSDPREQVTGTAVLLVDGVPASTWTSAVPGVPTFGYDLKTLATGPVVVTFDLTGLQDVAGNGAPPMVERRTVPLWFPLFGPGPLQVAGADLVAREAVVTRRPVDSSAFPEIYFVDGSGQVVRSFAGSILTSALATPGVVPSRLSASLARDDRSDTTEPIVTWAEAAAGSTASIRLVASSTYYTVTRPAAAGSSPPRLVASSEGYVGWTEPDGVGGRVVSLLDHEGNTIDVPTVPGTSPSDAVLSRVFDPALNVSTRLLAWIDAAPPASRLVISTAHSQDFPLPFTPWSVQVASGNVDPAQAASEPTVHGDRVAWLEAGSVRAGRIDLTTGVLVHEDPVSLPGARQVRFLPWHTAGGAPAAPVLVWVEPGPSGDVIAARRWLEGIGWTVLSPVNEGVTGEVRTLAVAGSVVTWTDAAGHVFARRLNR